MKLGKGLLFAGLVTLSQASWAVGDLSLGAITAQGQATFKALSEDLGAALSYKAITPAEPLGTVGFDIGLEATFTELNSIDKWGGAIGATDLSYLPLPKLHLHKGLPFSLDVGAVYSSVPGSNVSYWGGELRYSFVSGNLALPAIAVRGSYTSLVGVDDISLSTKGLELTVSKGFLMFTPYAGLGQVWIDSEPGAAFSPLTSESISATKMFLGLNLNMGLMNLAFEGDKTGESASYSAKLGFRF